MLRFGDEKMSKSLGNVERLADALDEWGAETLLLLFARAHYRSPMDYTDDTLAQARRAGEGLREAIRSCARRRGDGSGDARSAGRGRPRRAAAFDAALDDDLATPRRSRSCSASAVRQPGDRRPAAAGRAGGGRRRDARLAARRARTGRTRAPTTRSPAAVVRAGRGAPGRPRGRDFARADALRDQIAAAGFVVRDAGDGFELVPAPR